MTLLDEKVVLITGAARGIGFAIAQKFAQEGARLILADSGVDPRGNNEDAKVVEAAAATLKSEFPQLELMTYAGDLTQPPAVQTLFSEAQARWGGVDVLIHSAGTVRDRSLFDMELEDFTAVVNNKLISAFVCSQAFARAAKRSRKGGSIVLLSGISGFLGNLGQANESSAQAALYGLARTSSIELQKWGVRVNVIAPLAKTRLTEDLPMFEKVEGTIEAKHVAPAALFFASELSQSISGKVLSVAGGRMSAFALSESQGRMKEADGGIWTPEEIAENFESLSRA